jgi:hypothetical protein
MKKFLSAMALVPVLMGAGCAGGASTGAGTSAPTVVAWSEGEDCGAKLLVSGPASKSIGYPNGPKDVICASESTMSKLQAGDEDKVRGTAKVVLGNLKKIGENRYDVDIVSATDVK